MRARLGPGYLLLGAALLVAPAARAQTWAAGQDPGFKQLFAVDATGEAGWLYGQEDVANDGLDSFKQTEQSIDIRTAYAATDAARFWCRIYVSDSSNPGGNISAYVFIDNDKNPATGGTTAATEVDPKFTSAPSTGYEYVLGVKGNESLIGLWEWSGAWKPKNIPPAQVDVEAGSSTDPINVNGNPHGYLQAAIDLGAVGLTSACNANLYVRTTSNNPAIGEGDLEVGKEGACLSDTNNNGVPDHLETPTTGCTSDAQCPNGGVCVAGKCELPKLCTTPAECTSGYTCTNGRCIVNNPGTTCTTRAECGELVCSGGQCVACTAAPGECGAGWVCGPDGRCLSSSGGGGGPCQKDEDCSEGEACVKKPPEASTGVCGPYDLENRAKGEELEGGACACSAPGLFGPTALGSLLFGLPLLWIARRLRRRSARRSS